MAKRVGAPVVRWSVGTRITWGLALMGMAFGQVVDLPGESVSGPVGAGGFSIPASWPRERFFWLQDVAGRRVPAVVHREGRLGMLHAWAPAGARGILYRAPEAEEARPTLELAEGPEGLSVEAGSARVVFGDVIGLPGWVLQIHPVPAQPTWRVLHACALRVELAREGATIDPGLHVRVHVTVHAGAERIDLAYHAVARGSLDWSFVWEATSRDPLVLEVGGDRLASKEQDVVLERADGKWHHEGRALDGNSRVGVLRARTPLAFAMPAARGRQADRLELLAHGRGVRFGLSGERLGAGEGRLLRWSLGFGDDVPTPLRFARPVADRGRTDPALESRVAELLRGFLDDPRHGLWDGGPGAGDWDMGGGSPGNLEFDTTFGLLRRALAWGDASAFQQACASADHLLSQDLDAQGSGLFFPHGRTHRTGPVEAGHHWVDGLVELDRLTGDSLRRPLLDQVLRAQRVHLASLDLPRELPRSLGWGLQALVAAAERRPNDPKDAAEVKRWRRYILGRQTGEGLLALAKPSRDGLSRESPFVQGGILVPALARALAFGGTTLERNRVGRLGHALADLSVLGRGRDLRLAEALHVDRDRGKCVHATGQENGEGTALFLAGVVSGVPGLARRPSFQELRKGLAARLTANRKVLIGGELSVLLRSLPGLSGW